MKDDAIARLSDQVMALTAIMQEFERKQQPYAEIDAYGHYSNVANTKWRTGHGFD